MIKVGVFKEYTYEKMDGVYFIGSHSLFIS